MAGADIRDDGPNVADGRREERKMVTFSFVVDDETKAAAEAVAERHDLDLEEVTLMLWRRMADGGYIPFAIEDEPRKTLYEVLCELDEKIARGEDPLAGSSEEDGIGESNDSSMANPSDVREGKRRSAAGALAEYADPRKRKFEKDAWARAAVKKHAANS